MTTRARDEGADPGRTGRFLTRATGGLPGLALTFLSARLRARVLLPAPSSAVQVLTWGVTSPQS